jgi:Arc/MetJ-type ribon-helix-helix transcriptional regulator
LSEAKHEIIWTIKVDKKLDAAVQESISMLGYTSKAELTREAIREFLIRRKLYSLIGGELSEPILKQDMTPAVALHELSIILKKIPKDIIEEETIAARKDIASAFFEGEQ